MVTVNPDVILYNGNYNFSASFDHSGRYQKAASRINY